MAQQNGRFGLPHNFPQLFLGGGSGRGPPSRPSVDGPFPATPAPTAETQELYNKMKQIESELDLGDRIKLQGGHGGESSPVELLEPPTPSQADTMSRSPSVRSHTHSLPYGSNPVDIAEVVEQEERVGKKRRAVRRGPLDSYTKARAALLRKLGVCDGCRERKVRCRHHDMSAFERNYQQSKLQSNATPPGGQPLLQRLPSPYQPPALQLPTYPPLSNPAFLHMGGHITTNSLAAAIPHTGFDLREGSATTDDFDSILLDMASDSARMMAAPPPAPLYDTSRQQALQLPSWIGVPPSSGQLSLSNTFAPVHFPEPRDRRLPICRYVGAEWECQWLDGTDAPANVFGAEVCGLRHPDLLNLSNHFRSAHAAFQDAVPAFYWLCTACKLSWTESLPVCPQCSYSGRPTFEKWFFGQVTTALTWTTSASSILLSSQATSPMIESSGLSPNSR